MAGTSGEPDGALRRPRMWSLAPLVAVLVAASLAIGFSVNFLRDSRGPSGSFAQLPGCSHGGASLDVATEADASATLPAAWAELASAFASQTGGCLSVASASTSSGNAALTTLEVDALIGPEVPTVSTPGDLAEATYDVPLMVSPVVILVNAQGLAPTLNLSAAALAGAYLGTVAEWSSPEIVATNPDLHSGLNVSVVYLTGPSEANELFSTYLAEWNGTFRTVVGAGPNVTWPVGTPAASPSGLISLVASTPGAIGYEPTDLCPSVPSPVVCADVQAGPDSFLPPTAAEVTAAATLEANSTAAAKGAWANVSGVAPPNSTVYPMIETTYAVVYRDLGVAYGPLFDLNASKWLIALLFWVASDYGTAGSVEATSGYVPLPAGFATMAEETALSVTYLGNWILLPPSALQEGGEEGGEGGGESGEA